MLNRNVIQKIYHLADERNWQSIQANGLLSAAQLLKHAGLSEWIYRHRPESLQLPDGSIIRDQRPMPPEALARCLADGLCPADWYALLNHQIFFWIELERLNRQRKACNTPQYIMTIDAKSLVKHYASHTTVTPFNTGNARRKAAYRGKTTFVPYNEWVNSGWESETLTHAKLRPSSHKPVELTVAKTIINIFDFVVDIRRLEPGEDFQF